MFSASTPRLQGKLLFSKNGGCSISRRTKTLDGGASLLAWQIRRLFEDDTLAVTLGSEARIVARRRHSPAAVEQQLIGAYNELVGGAAPVHSV